MKELIKAKIQEITETLEKAGLSQEQIDKLLNPIKDEFDKCVCGLVWDNRLSSIPEAFNDALPFFERIQEKDISGGKRNNLLIEGDNLYALLGMQYTHVDRDGNGMVDVIYIDPPYNTGSVTFAYNVEALRGKPTGFYGYHLNKKTN